MTDITEHSLQISDLKLFYRAAGAGDPVLLLHGWPTSSFLWRNVMPSIAAGNRVIALDMPGFGQSDKPLNASYSFRYFERVLDEFLAKLGIDKIGLAVHDLGGPIGLYWASRNPARVDRLALLNTLVYPQMSWAVKAFVLACRVPGLRSVLASPFGLRTAMRIGVHDKGRLTPDLFDGVLAPFASRDARRALCKTGYGLVPKGFEDIAAWLPTFAGPVRIVYGARDRFLPDVAKTMTRVSKDLPQARVTALPDCGHFLQEDQPDEVGRLLAGFFSDQANPMVEATRQSKTSTSCPVR